jgi:hypothetical protein
VTGEQLQVEEQLCCSSFKTRGVASAYSGESSASSSSSSDHMPRGMCRSFSTPSLAATAMQPLNLPKLAFSAGCRP